MILDKLFFGFPLTFNEAMILKDPASLSSNIFIQKDHPLNLHFLQHEEKIYLGKFISEQLDLTALELLEAHLISIFNQISVNERKNLPVLIGIHCED
ncbi:MAG: hypothetical protein Q8K60_00040 [Parachlamydiaceae bacterium]|nr:hypothetical protein [Parachlamydiaceae bacterium]